MGKSTSIASCLLDRSGECPSRRSLPSPHVVRTAIPGHSPRRRLSQSLSGPTPSRSKKQAAGVEALSDGPVKGFMEGARAPARSVLQPRSRPVMKSILLLPEPPKDPRVWAEPSSSADRSVPASRTGCRAPVSGSASTPEDRRASSTRTSWSAPAAEPIRPRGPPPASCSTTLEVWIYLSPDIWSCCRDSRRWARSYPRGAAADLPGRDRPGAGWGPRRRVADRR